MFGVHVTNYNRKIYFEQLADFLPDKIIASNLHLWKKERFYICSEKRKAVIPGSSGWRRTVP